MDGVIVGLIVLIAATFIGRRVYAAVKSARNAKEGCSDCGCGTASNAKTDWGKS